MKRLGGDGAGSLGGVGGALPDPPGGRGAFTIASFNVLGDNHSGGRGTDASWRDGVQRLAGGSFGLWAPSPRHTDNTVIWRRSMFRFIRGDSVMIRYFDGQPTRMPSSCSSTLRLGDASGWGRSTTPLTPPSSTTRAATGSRPPAARPPWPAESPQPASTS